MQAKSWHAHSVAFYAATVDLQLLAWDRMHDIEKRRF